MCVYGLVWTVVSRGCETQFDGRVTSGECDRVSGMNGEEKLEIVALRFGVHLDWKHQQDDARNTIIDRRAAIISSPDGSGCPVQKRKPGWTENRERDRP